VPQDVSVVDSTIFPGPLLGIRADHGASAAIEDGANRRADSDRKDEERGTYQPEIAIEPEFVIRESSGVAPGKHLPTSVAEARVSAQS